ncbi:tetratricopeptide repeat protein [Suttonella sp. R2A3]|uniref:YfgM family protein n=1 Tax=Suttonella sp. R2A3 TaxID=2908648 RepID=UPI001F19215C|nr:tetratricopeptide repeat protein [Suttonella sp. R2A3]UJF23800.1 tetratricopeptide repeat protein [Suttonella sp. R2A3]
MMERTDEETGELVREWLQRYGVSIIVGLVLAVGAVGGYQWWQSAQLKQASEQSALLNQLGDAVEANQAQETQRIYAEMDQSAQTIGLAQLLMAKEAATNNDLARAKTFLGEAVNAKDPLVVDSARWQLANLEMRDGQYDAALSELQALKGSAYANQVALLEAVIYQQQGNLERAAEAYRSIQGDAAMLAQQLAAVEGELATATNPPTQ